MTAPTVQASKIQEVAIGNFVPHPANVIAVTLTSIRTETGEHSYLNFINPVYQTCLYITPYTVRED